METLTTEYDALTLWSYPRDYGGQTWYGWYPVVGRSRDSEALQNSNYRRVLEDLKALDTELLEADIDPRQGDYDSPGDSTVCDTCCNHWAVGWVETVYVHSSNAAACKLANEIVNGLQDYAVYDESDLSELETEEQDEAWEHTVRGEFSTALGKKMAATYENSWRSAQRDGESDADYDKRFDAAMDWLEDGADISPENLWDLFRQLQDMGNSEWENGYIDAESVVSRGLRRSDSQWYQSALSAFKHSLREAMGDAKYDHGIVAYVDPNQLKLELA